MKHLILSIALLVPFALGAQIGNNTIEAFKAEKLFGEGKSFYEKADFTRALAVFNEVSTLNPDHPQVYLFMAESYYALKDYDKALDFYTLAVRQNPEDPELRNSQGTAAAQIELYDAAAAYFYEALKLDPDHLGAKENLALVDQLRKKQGTYTPPGQGGWTLEDTNPQNINPANPNYGTGFNPSNQDRYDNFNTGSISDANYTPTNSGKNPFEYVEPEAPNLEPEKVSRDGQTFGREDLKIGSQTDMSLKILQIQFTENATTLTVEIQSVGDEPFPINLAGVGSKEAFYLTDQSMRRAFRLKNVRGLAGWPKRPYNLQVRERKVIALEFERLPDDVQVFHLLEGSTNRSYSWDFYDVELIE
ncbi:MAG: tetratricopeptide repeat protein [Bacteroidia bacterium]